MALTKVSRGLLSTGIVDNSTTTAITIDSSGNVGIGTGVAPGINGSGLSIFDALYPRLTFRNDTTGDSSAATVGTSAYLVGDNFYLNNQEAGILSFGTNATERMRIDSSGDAEFSGKVRVGTSTNGTAASMTFDSASNSSALQMGNNSGGVSPGGVLLYSTSSNEFQIYQYSGVVGSETYGGPTLALNSAGNMGIGGVGVAAPSGIRFVVYGSGSGGAGLYFGSGVLLPTNNTGGLSDNVVDLGASNYRFNDAFVTNGVTSGSDGNLKQDIEALSDAEQRVAVACKGLLRKFRWIDAVEAKGDDARIHFGIIAQDLQAAFEAEGLDAGRYAMFMSNTWWETQTEVAAVEAVEATEDTEAIEAVDAYTRTDTYDTAEEAPEGATERTRLGIRYSELLAFIISAI